jgi:hypothetical protein
MGGREVALLVVVVDTALLFDVATIIIDDEVEKGVLAFVNDDDDANASHGRIAEEEAPSTTNATAGRLDDAILMMILCLLKF